jgi:hypothetical protein
LFGCRRDRGCVGRSHSYHWSTLQPCGRDRNRTGRGCPGCPRNHNTRLERTRTHRCRQVPSHTR